MEFMNNNKIFLKLGKYNENKCKATLKKLVVTFKDGMVQMLLIRNKSPLYNGAKKSTCHIKEI